MHWREKAGVFCGFILLPSVHFLFEFVCKPWGSAPSWKHNFHFLSLLKAGIRWVRQRIAKLLLSFELWSMKMAERELNTCYLTWHPFPSWILLIIHNIIFQPWETSSHLYCTYTNILKFLGAKSLSSPQIQLCAPFLMLVNFTSISWSGIPPHFWCS